MWKNAQKKKTMHKKLHNFKISLFVYYDEYKNEISHVFTR